MNLTLACSQSDFVSNHVNIIPAPVKDIFEKSSDEVPDRTAMKLVLEDFMAQMKELKDQMSSMQSKHVDLENRLSEEHKLRKSAGRKIKSLQEKLDYAHQERFGDRRQRYNLKLKQVIQTAGRIKMIMMEPMIRFVRIQLIMLHLKR